jgi:uncharacterized damage-inducible protein DinB
MTDLAIKYLLAALDEGFDGPGESSGYLDTGAALNDALAKLSAEEASRNWGGNSVAAHAYHVLFGLDAFAAAISGKTPHDWNESWRVKEVDAPSWAKLRSDLNEGRARLRTAIESHAHKGEAQMAGAVSAVAHVAYHVGAIRQKIAAQTPAGSVRQ